jgi:hypothetical protein
MSPWFGGQIGDKMTYLLKSAIRRLVPALLIVLLFTMPAKSRAGVAIAITIAPPVLPVYTQPPCPSDGYLWMPGYWAYGAVGYYWVPGTWVLPPRPGLLWTPGYWGFGGGVYGWHAGYWGPHVGFYGGVNYGFGYVGSGFQGGYWSGGHFLYNTAVTRVNVTTVRNVYTRTVVVNRTYINNTRVSYNGPGGIAARPTPSERMAMNEHHFAQTQGQLTHERAASMNRAQFASVNHGRPGTFAMARPVNVSHAAPMHNPGPANHGPQNAHPQTGSPEYRRSTEQRREGPARQEHPREEREHEAPR